MSIYDKASLVLIPSGTKTSKVYSQKPVNGDGDFTFSRSTAATRVNADGNIEKETQNLLLRSNEFSGAVWALTNSPTITGGQAGYDGTNDAWKLEASTTGSSRSIHQIVYSSGVQVFSVYVKAGTTDWIRLNLSGIGNRYFDIANGVVGGSGSIDGFITDVGGGWYRCSVLGNGSSTAPYIFLASDNGNLSVNAGDNIYIQDAQLEQGLVARDYIETTTAAVEGGITDNVPRLDYTDSSCPALLLEPQRTNELTHSEYFGNWNVYRGTLTANDATSPEGVDNAYRYEEDSATGQHFVRKTISMTSGTTYTASAFVKADEITSVKLGSSNAANWNASATFNLSNGSVSSGTGTIEDYGNNWYRCIVTAACTTTATIGLEITTSSGAGSSGDGLYIYGAMIEAGSYATSYIPTYGTSVTRNVESMSKDSLTDYIGQSEGTFYIEFELPDPDTNSNAMWTGVEQGSSQATNRVLLYSSANNNLLRIDIRANSSSVGISGATITNLSANTNYKVAVRYTSGNVAVYVNGVSEFTSSNTWTFSNDLTKFNFYNQGQAFQGKLKQSMLFTSSLSNEELAALTTI